MAQIIAKFLAISASMLLGLSIFYLHNGYAAVGDLHVIDAVPCSGDRDIVVDTISLREWLSLDVTGGFSFNDLTGAEHDCNPTCTKGPFAGWTFASEQDVLELMRNGGLSPYGGENSDTAQEFMNIIGITYSYASCCFPASINQKISEAITLDVIDLTNVRLVKIETRDVVTRGSDAVHSAYTTQGVLPFETDARAWLYRSYLASLDAIFCASPSVGPAPLTVRFSNESILADSWLWDFGDGTTSTEKNPTHRYLAAGAYTVSLMTSGRGGSSTETKIDFIKVDRAVFSDVATNAVEANSQFSSLISHTWLAENDWNLYRLLPYYSKNAVQASDNAYLQAVSIVGDSTTDWGFYAVQYAEAELSYRKTASYYFDLAATLATEQNHELASYFGMYGLSLSAMADVYNAGTIWCSSMESGIGATETVAEPYFSRAAYYGWLSNLYLSTAIAYSFYAVNDPSYYSLISLYSSGAYSYAQIALENAENGLLSAGSGVSFWGTYAVQYAEANMNALSAAISNFELAVQANQSSAGKSYLIEGFYRGVSWANLYTGYVIWCASMESKGGTK